MSAVKKIPQRMCVVCRQMKAKSELIRIVHSNETVVVDTTGKLNGRGIYLCASSECIAKALKSKGFVKQHGFSLECVAQELESLVEK